MRASKWIAAIWVALPVVGCESTVVIPVRDAEQDEHAYEVIERLTNAPCMPRPLVTDPHGRVPCLIAEARSVESCSCDRSTGRLPLTDDLVAEFIRGDEIAAGQGFDCLCEIAQLDTETGVDQCLYHAAPDPTVDGWCYVDAEAEPPFGDPALVAECPEGAQRTLRFVGDAEIVAGAIVYLVCPADMEAAAHDA